MKEERIEIDMASLWDEAEDVQRHLKGDVRGGEMSGSKNGSHGVGKTATVFKVCRHPGTQVIFTIEGVSFYGAKASDIFKDAEPLPGTLVVNCSGKLLGQPKGFLASPWDFDRYVMTFRELAIAWPDMGTPPLVPRFWKGLWREIKRYRVKHVIACCIGSHGRTGTALAALMIAKGAGLSEAVDLIRAKHCKEAIETQGQIDYLRWIEESLSK